MKPPSTMPVPEDDDFKDLMAPVWRQIMTDIAPVMESAFKGIEFDIPAITNQLKLDDLSRSTTSNLKLSEIKLSDTGLSDFLAAYQPQTDLYKNIAAQSGVTAAFNRLSESLVENAAFSPDLAKLLSEKFQFYQPDNLWSATQLAATVPEVAEAVEKTVDDHPAEVEEFVTTVTGKTRVQWQEMSASQRRALLKESMNLIGMTVITSLASSPELVIIQVIYSVLMFVMAISEIEANVLESREDGDAQE